MSEWLNQAIADAESLQAYRAENNQDWLSEKRQASLALLKNTTWPSRRVEAWKYTPVRALENASVTRIDAKNSQASSKAVTNNAVTKNDVIENLDVIDIVINDGQLSSLGEINLPEGVSIKTFDQVTNEERQAIVDHFASIKPTKHIFGLVNDVLATSCVFIDVAANAEIANPIRLLHQLSSGCEVHSRVFVRLGNNAKCVVIEHFSGNSSSVNSCFTEFYIAESANLEHYRLGLQTDKAVALCGNHFYLCSQANINSTLVGFGSDLSRLDIDVIHGGENAFAKMNAIFLLKDKELFDLHTTIEHAVPNGTTEENVRGIVADQSKAVFNGRIHIHKDAQKTLAELNNRNLLLSEKAEINTKPELEIYADDVRCAHGATIAEIDKKALYYLQSRGISPEQAKVMLNFGFINELVDQMPNQSIAEWLRPQLRDRFAQMQ